MAYKINASHRGFYILYSLEMEGKKLLTITKFMNLDKNIWRHMFVKQDI
jgi:ribosomal protein S6